VEPEAHEAEGKREGAQGTIFSVEAWPYGTFWLSWGAPRPGAREKEAVLEAKKG